MVIACCSLSCIIFSALGTLLASGSDDLNVVIWNWIRNRPSLVYDSGHRSNVFQVGTAFTLDSISVLTMTDLNQVIVDLIPRSATNRFNKKLLLIVCSICFMWLIQFEYWFCREFVHSVWITVYQSESHCGFHTQNFSTICCHVSVYMLDY